VLRFDLPHPPGFRNSGGNFRHFVCVQNSEPAVTDDAQLIEATLAGKPTAFGELVRKYQDRLFNTIAHVIGSREDALDAVQEAFVQAFLKLETFQQSSAFYTWLYRIAFNCAATQRRRRKPMLSVEQARESSGLEPADPQPGPEDHAQSDERCRQVREAIDGLTEEHRRVLVLREIDGCCYETIADILEVPIGTVRSRLHRARLQLREELKEVLAVDE
jgi:RNA polymerase sigma-70 factor (ECF subfamily)